ncbi:hypothetical protein AVEN_45791-1 [Araneus ventricosus]|uniref:Uncharacterized protein n=1 Tax=Araneus ventricosus TaxID=182803 RepID=A0A4Y2FE63_ARAVE|nr:hypothetical protein AVEN_45791-1 [Araneus ventricosus]
MKKVTRKLNEITRKDSYPLPRIGDTLDALNGSQWFTTLNLKNGYCQVEIQPEDREKTAFTTGQGFWQFKLKHVYKGPKENVLLLLLFGPHLIAVYEDSTLILWDIKAEEITAETPFTNFSISAIVHPSTYLNKILLGSLQGSLQLWNLRTNKLIYTFDGL